jgi:multidrug efflux pump subunit AcrB
MILKPLDYKQQRGLIGFINRGLAKVGGRSAIVLRGILCVLFGLGVGAGAYFLLSIHLVHEVISEQLPLTEARMLIIAGIVAVLAAWTCRAWLSGGEGSAKKRGPLEMFLHLFDRAVVKVTGGYAAILRRIITRRVLTLLVVGAFGYGILMVNDVLPTGFIPQEDQGMIYGVVQTPPG